MALSHPVKLVLKSTTTQTLSDRFTEMMRNKSIGVNRQKAREDNITQTRASAKNRRLAEQMSHRRDAVMDQFDDEVDVKSRLDQSKIKTPNVKERLGRSTSSFNNNSVQNRLGGSRGRGRGRENFSRPFNRSPGGIQNSRLRGGSRASLRGTSRGSYQQRGGRFQVRGRGPVRGSRGINRGSPRGRSRGRGRGRGGSRGGNSKSFFDRNDLDSELDSYMSKSM